MISYCDHNPKKGSQMSPHGIFSGSTLCHSVGGLKKQALEFCWAMFLFI